MKDYIVTTPTKQKKLYVYKYLHLKVAITLNGTDINKSQQYYWITKFQ